ncbi:MAG: type II toxin-antitoxin system RelE/ParE family toxin [Proteobacteria bacterium]|nr:type II toxin-antitoxin system RelE/ParE family toxin [Pseudomonadota bacterium]
MKRIAFSPRARRDLDGVWRYTIEHWGVDQAERYVRSLQVALDAVASGAVAPRSCDEIRAGYFKAAAGSHIAFYRLDVPDRLDVIRILHRRMDFPRHL